jgi:hypothetical protein
VNDTGATIVASDVREASHPITRGAMLYDASLPGHADEGWFDPDRWHGRVSVERQAGGRGTVAFLRDGARRWVLRPTGGGGAVARLLDDRYSTQAPTAPGASAMAVAARACGARLCAADRGGARRSGAMRMRRRSCPRGSRSRDIAATAAGSTLVGNRTLHREVRALGVRHAV